MSVVLAVTNQKGGVAKTTSCMSIGACLAELGRRTLVVDLDPQAHLTLAAGLRAEDLPWTVADLLGDPEARREPFQAPQATGMDGLDILPADMRLAGLERSLYGRAGGYEGMLAQALKPWQEAYDFILLDCPPALGALALMALTAAQWALIPAQCEYFSTQGVLQLLDTIEAVRARTNPELRYALFVTLFDRRNLVSRRVREQLNEHFSEALLEPAIGMDTKLRECAIAGEPVITYAPRTRASQQYRSLTADLLRRVE